MNFCMGPVKKWKMEKDKIHDDGMTSKREDWEDGALGRSGRQ